MGVMGFLSKSAGIYAHTYLAVNLCKNFSLSFYLQFFHHDNQIHLEY